MRKQNALEELQMLQEQHEIVVARQKRLEESLIRKQRAEQLDEETDW